MVPVIPGIQGVEVAASIVASPLGQAAAIERVMQRLRDAGWIVQTYSAGTHVDTFLGMPIPTANVLRVTLHRSTPYSEREAADALAAAVAPEGWRFSLLGDYAAEVTTEVIEPTIEQVTSPAKWPWWLKVGVGAAVVIGGAWVVDVYGRALRGWRR